MGKRRHGGLSTVLCILCCTGALAWLPAADSSSSSSSAWHPEPALSPLSAPAPTAGAELPPEAAPHFGFPLQPTLGPTAGSEGYPFIGSNPTVPLPTGMTTDVLPMPDTTASTKVMGYAASSVTVQITMIGFALFFSILFLLSSTP